MKRIDLHLHTQNLKGDGAKRVIDTKGFVKKMDSNGIGICAITNHNHFDVEEFRTIKAAKHDFVIFTGIELDVVVTEDADSRHIIVIGDPDNEEQFKEVFSGKKEDAKELCLNYDAFITSIKRFDKKKVIVIPHFFDKDNKRKVTIEEKNRIKNDLSEYIVILEPSKLRSMGIINAHNELSLIGSDIKDWSNYEIEALKLPEMKFAITSYGRFYEIARESKQFVRSVLDGCDRESVDIKSQSLFIYKDINIIFGGKGSGKTILLKDYLYPQFVKKGLNTILHEGKNYHDEYVKMLETFSNKTMVADTDKDRIIEKLSSVLTYKESKPSNALEQVKKYCDNKSSNKLALLIKKTEAVYSEASPDSYKSIIKNYRDASMHIHYVKKINNDTRDDKSAHRSALNQELETLNKELREKMLDSSCDFFSIHQTDKFLKNLKAIVEKKTGKVGKPNNYGFSKLVRERRVLIDNATTVIKDLSDIEKMECNRLGSLPDKGEILFRVLIKSLKHTTRAAKQEGFVRSNDNKKILKKIVELNVSTFDKINEYFSPEEKARDINELFEQIVVKECSVTKVDGARYTPSDGEESILSITGIIQNTDYDCYLFDEIERGLGNKYVAEYLIPQLKNLRDLDKYVILSTHNANIAVSTLPSQTIYCDYRTDKLRDYYYQGDMFSDELKGIDSGELINWEDNAISHLEGGESMFGIRRNVWY